VTLMTQRGLVVTSLSISTLVVAMVLFSYFQVATPNAGPITDFLLMLSPDSGAVPTMKAAPLISFSEANILVSGVTLAVGAALFCLFRALYSHGITLSAGPCA
jgi:hypothetical protein